jgi:hypothetical protein
MNTVVMKRQQNIPMFEGLAQVTEGGPMSKVRRLEGCNHIFDLGVHSLGRESAFTKTKLCATEETMVFEIPTQLVIHHSFFNHLAYVWDE